MDQHLVTVSSIGDEEVLRTFSPGQKSLEVLGSRIAFFYSPEAPHTLWVTAKTSKDLPHPWLENWLGEPLRILLGRLAFPRLVARNLGDGTAQVWLRNAPHTQVVWPSLALAGVHGDTQEFWGLYGNILEFIACGGKDRGLEAHPLTRFYEEAIQATGGSRWVLAMTLGSMVEGLLRIAYSTRPGSSLSVENKLKALEKKGVTQLDQRVAWRELRHVVSHGQLVSPWSEKEGDRRVELLRDLVFNVTRHIVSPEPQT